MLLPSRRNGVIVATLAALGIACRGEPTAPIVEPKPEPLAVSVALIGSPSEVVTESPNGVRLTCEVGLVATAKGGGGATWQDGVMRFYLGPSRLFVEDSLPLSAADVQSAWGRNIATGEQPQTNWRFSASVPFEIELEFRLSGQNGGPAPAPAKTRFACGPKPAALGTAAPSITQLSVSPSGDLQPGEGFDVTYTASSPYALWSTTLAISGPFTARRDVAERSTTSATRTLHFVVPAGAQLGIPLTVTALSIDPGLRQGERTMQTSGTVVDRTPPVVQYALFANGPAVRLAGQFVVGDVLSLQVGASDNNALEWLVWELGAPANVRDSVRASAVTSYAWNIPLRIRPEWIGSPILSIYVRDAAGLTTMLASQPDSLRFYPLVSRSATTPVGVGSFANLGDLAYDAKRNVFYIALGGTSDVAVLDVATMTYGTRITLPARVGALDLSPSGDSLIVALPSSKALAVVDLARPSAAPTTIDLAMLDTAGALYPGMIPQLGLVRVAANGKAIVMLSARTKSGDAMVEVDLRSGVHRVRTDGRSTNPYWITTAGATPDRSRIVLLDFACPRSYFAATDAFGGCRTYVPVSNPRGMTFDAAGQRFSTGDAAFDVDLNRLRVADRINGRVPASAISADGAYLYLAADRTVSKMRIADGQMTEGFTIPLSAHRMFLSPTGDWMIAFDDIGPVLATRVDLR